jgi:hypothetical protein
MFNFIILNDELKPRLFWDKRETKHTMESGLHKMNVDAFLHLLKIMGFVITKVAFQTA